MLPVLLCFLSWLSSSHSLVPISLQRRINFRSNKMVASVTVDSETQPKFSIDSFDYMKEDKLPWLSEGYKTWDWNTYKINYVDIGKKSGEEKPPLLLIHGFGASVYHWRYNIPILARDYHVFAIDLLGLGLSDKPIVEYSGELWRDQVLAFIEEVVRPQAKLPCVVAGNSIGGFTALYAASSQVATAKDLINGCILLNGAGRFRSPEPEPIDNRPQWQKDIATFLQKIIVRFTFEFTKQPARIEQVLKQVYPVDSSNVDAELVESIRFPAQNPNAPEVFYRIISRNGDGPPVYFDDMVSQLKVPLLLLWGEKDPWIRPRAADSIQALYPAAKRVSVDAGHCPHDEAPQAVNAAIGEFMASVFKL